MARAMKASDAALSMLPLTYFGMRVCLSVEIVIVAIIIQYKHCKCKRQQRFFILEESDQADFGSKICLSIGRECHDLRNDKIPLRISIFAQNIKKMLMPR